MPKAMPTDPQHLEELGRALDAIRDQWVPLVAKEERDRAFYSVVYRLGKRSIIAALALNRAYQTLRPQLEPTAASFSKILATVVHVELDSLFEDYGVWHYMYGSAS